MTGEQNRPDTIDPLSYEGAITTRDDRERPEPPWVVRLYRKVDNVERHAIHFAIGVAIGFAGQGILDIVLFGLVFWLLGGTR